MIKIDNNEIKEKFKYIRELSQCIESKCLNLPEEEKLFIGEMVMFSRMRLSNIIAWLEQFNVALDK